MSIIKQDYGSLGNDVQTQMLIAPVLAEMVSDRAYAVGEQFIVDNVLYKITQAISAADVPLVVDSNCEVSDSITQQMKNGTILAEAEATSSTTYKQILEALKTNGGQALLDAYNNSIKTIKLVTPYLIYHPSTVLEANSLYFFCVAIGTHTNIYGLSISLINDSHAAKRSSDGNTPVDETNNIIQSDYLGKWYIIC